ncbi:STAS domain-containing protein [Dactylosporangium vinaceum]|uniref:Anti-sigma factor antagonist n=1 Tax=Dactylosporangium vinaceum TaxID=53362 RepID=A0ABV5MDI2_9ACTN|nr:STAS domain-containing protein [Dactylosporangium vinaceum]UAC01154.1 STAS domain-containing protein [Dactylosporangium vinaceum]
MDVSWTTRPGRECLIVQLSGVVDMANTPRVRQRLQEVLDDGTRSIVLDLGEVPLIDSSALGLIVWLHKQLRAHGGGAAVAGPQPIVRQVFELTSVDHLMPVHDTVAAAEAALVSPA